MISMLVMFVMLTMARIDIVPTAHSRLWITAVLLVNVWYRAVTYYNHIRLLSSCASDFVKHFHHNIDWLATPIASALQVRRIRTISQSLHLSQMIAAAPYRDSQMNWLNLWLRPISRSISWKYILLRTSIMFIMFTMLIMHVDKHVSLMHVFRYLAFYIHLFNIYVDFDLYYAFTTEKNICAEKLAKRSIGLTTHIMSLSSFAKFSRPSWTPPPFVTIVLIMVTMIVLYTIRLSSWYNC